MHRPIYLFVCLCFSLTVELALFHAPPPPLDLVGPASGEYFQHLAPTSGKKFHNLSEAIQDAENFITEVMDAQAMPSLVFSISVKGKTIFEKAWGQSDMENSVAARLTTKYRIASISKTFTSVLIGTLVDRGLVQYEDSIWKYLSERDFPYKTWNGTPVDLTVAQLMDHTGGTHVTTLADFNTVIPGVSCTQMVHKFKDEPLSIEPGSDFIYSNYGYQLVGAIIESVTGQTYQQAMRELFVQLGLNSTHVETSDLIVQDKAHYYMYTSDVKTNIPTALFDDLFHVEGWWPSGSLMSTVGDLVKYGNAIVDSYKGRPHSILSEKTLKETWVRRTTQFKKFIYHPINDYGYGWFIAYVSPSINPNIVHRNFTWHSGGLLGTTTFLIIYPEEEAVAAVMTNKGYVKGLDSMAIKAMENIYDFC